MNEPDALRGQGVSLTDDERQGVIWAIEKGIHALRTSGFEFPAKKNIPILESAKEKIANG